MNRYHQEKCLPPLVSLMILLLTMGPSVAFADEPLFNTHYDTLALLSEPSPSFTFDANVPFKELNIKIIRNDGKVISKELKNVSQDRTISIRLEQPAGTFHYKVQVTGKTEDSEMTFAPYEQEFDVTRVDSLEVDSDGEYLDIDHNQMKIKVNRPVKKVRLWLYDTYKTLLSTIDMDTSNEPKKELLIRWPKQPRDVSSLKLRVYDEYGLWSESVLEPFWIEIPYPSIHFDTKKTTFNKQSEEPKLEAAMDAINKVLLNNRYDSNTPLQLYIIGYTDTVGSRQNNLALSKGRAKAVGHWLVKHGVKIPVYYQGFGEDVLIKNTPDNTDEPENRRVVIMIGSTKPNRSDLIPKRDWVRIR